MQTNFILIGEGREVKKMAEFDYFEPTDLAEACKLLDAYRGEAAILAGGTDLLVKVKEEIREPRYVINIKRIPGLSYIAYDEGGLKIGALTLFRDIAESETIREKYPALHLAAQKMGSPLIRNLATLGGNLSQSSPSADSAPPLLVYGAQVKLVSSRGERSVPLEDFFLGPGSNARAEDEVVTEVWVPASDGQAKSNFMKISRRKGTDLAIVNVAALLRPDSSDGVCEDIRIALGAVAPVPIRAKKAEQTLIGKTLNPDTIREAALIAQEEVAPISDVRASAEYRLDMVRVLFEKIILEMI
jgi:carbon-monoxide dehydrogenase medium subunit